MALFEHFDECAEENFHLVSMTIAPVDDILQIKKKSLLHYHY